MEIAGGSLVKQPDLRLNELKPNGYNRGVP
jgi:hypothetical protein